MSAKSKEPGDMKLITLRNYWYDLPSIKVRNVWFPIDTTGYAPKTLIAKGKVWDSRPVQDE